MNFRRDNNPRDNGNSSPRPKGNFLCVCGGTGIVTVIAREGEFVSYEGVPIQAGKEQAVICRCNVGEWINARRAEEFKLSEFNSSMQSTKANTEPVVAKYEDILGRFEQPLGPKPDYASLYAEQGDEE